MSEVVEQEIDALLETAAGGSEDGLASPTGVPTYDFRRPERVSKDHMRALASIHEVFARNFGATLSGFLRTIIDVRVVGVEQLTYTEFIQSLPNPTCFVILQAPPLEGQMCLELSPLIVYPIIDRLLGGANQEICIPQRPLTGIEWGLIGRLVDRALDHLSEVWRNLVEARFEVVTTESNAQLVHIVAPSEVVVFITFEIKLGQNAGTMSMCIPFNVIESVLSRLTSQSWFYKPKLASDVQRKRLMRSLQKCRVDLRAYLGQTTLRLSELRALKPGDVIGVDKLASQDLILQIVSRNKFAGRAVQCRGRRALQITRRAELDESL